MLSNGVDCNGTKDVTILDVVTNGLDGSGSDGSILDCNGNT